MNLVDISLFESLGLSRLHPGSLETLILRGLEGDMSALTQIGELGFGVFSVVFLGFFPLLSLALAAFTLAWLPLLDRGRGRRSVREALGLPQPRAEVEGDRLQAGRLEEYLTEIRGGLLRSVLLLLIVGLIPFLGVVVGLVYYRLSPLPALRKLMEPGELDRPLQWVLPIVAVSLVAIQPLPMIGPLALPLLYLIFHGVYDSILRRRCVAPRELVAA